MLLKRFDYGACYSVGKPLRFVCFETTVIAGYDTSRVPPNLAMQNKGFDILRAQEKGPALTAEPIAHPAHAGRVPYPTVCTLFLVYKKILVSTPFVGEGTAYPILAGRNSSTYVMVVRYSYRVLDLSDSYGGRGHAKASSPEPLPEFPPRRFLPAQGLALDGLVASPDSPKVHRNTGEDECDDGESLQRLRKDGAAEQE